MRKLLTIMLSVFLFVSICTLSPCAYSEEQFGEISWQLLDDGVLFVFGNGIMPNNFHPWSDNNEASKQVKTIIIDEGITQLGYESFRGMSSVTKVQLPSTLKTINGWCFAGCSSLIDITLPEGLETLDTGCFAGCAFLKIDIPSTVSYIAITVFQGCPSLANINVASDSNYYSSINGVLFSNSGTTLKYYPTGRHEKEYVIPDGTEAIAMYAFYRIKNIEKVILPQGCRSIDTLAFMSCINLLYISLPESISSIGMSAFSGCESLDSVTILNDDCTMGSYCFPSSTTIICNKGSKAETFAIEGSYHLVYLDGTEYVQPQISWSISDSGILKVSGNGIIADDQHPWIEEDENNRLNIRNIIVEEGITQLGSNIFSSLPNLISVSLPNSLSTIGMSCFENCHSLEDIQLPDGLNTISIGSFSNCQALTVVNIPASVTSIGISSFDGCYSLKNINVSLESATFASLDGVLYSKDYRELLCYPSGREESVYDVKPGTNSIGLYAFYKVKNLEKINLPYGVSILKSYAFFRCSNLRNIILPETLGVISSGAFSNCDSLESLIIPNNVQSIFTTSIPSHTIIIGTKGSEADKFAYENNYTFVDIDELDINAVPDGTVYIEDEAFSNCGFTQIYIPASVRAIGSDAFDISTIIICIRGSYADKWAHSLGYKVICLDKVT